jgi:5-methylcytosine-specific restriction endonuclease McrA
MNKTIQTAKPKGSYKLGDPHPFVSNRYFKQYGRYRDGRIREVWVTENNLLNSKKIEKETNTARCKKWLQGNKNVAAAYRAARRGNMRVNYSSLPEHSKAIVKGIYEASQRVSECLRVAFHVDHIIPVSKGGTHSPENLQIVPAKWNLQKGNRHSGGFGKKI